MIARRGGQGDAERGAALVLAVAFLALLGLLVPTLLGLADTSFLTTNRLDDQRATTYAADGGLDGALQWARVNRACGSYGSPAGSCPTFQATVSGQTASVTFQSQTQLRDVDRTLTLTSTVKGTPRVVAQVVLRDSAAVSTPIGTLAGVDVLSWVYQR